MASIRKHGRAKLGTRRRKMGRPSLGAAARTQIITLKLSRAELAAVRAAVRELGAPTTVSSWFRDHGLAPLKRAGTAPGKRRPKARR